MWPGILSVSKTEFKPNATAIVFAHKALVSKFISSIAKEDERRQAAQEEEENNAEESKDEDQDTQATASCVSLSDFIPICSGRILSNGVPAGARPKGKAVEIHHHLFDALWNVGSKQIDAAILIPQQTADGATNQGGEEESTTQIQAQNETNIEGEGGAASEVQSVELIQTMEESKIQP